MRVYRLKDTILNCLTDKLFLDLGDEFTPVARVVQQEESYWELHYAVVQLLYPLYRLLRLANMRIGGMDRVKYYILQADRQDENTDSEVESDCEGEDEDSVVHDTDVLMDCFDEFKSRFYAGYRHYRKRIVGADHVRAAYLLTPNPVIMEHAKANQDSEDHLAINRLLVRTFLPGYVENDDEWEMKKAAVIDKFYEELGEFQNKTGWFTSKHIWMSAKNPEMVPYVWHKNYSLPYTQYLGKIACRVLSKVMGIGEAERHWKKNKHMRIGQRAKLSPEKAKKQACIAAAHSLELSKIRRKKSNKAGKMWTDKDFEHLKLGEKMVFILFYQSRSYLTTIKLIQILIARAVWLQRRLRSKGSSGVGLKIGSTCCTIVVATRSWQPSWE